MLFRREIGNHARRKYPIDDFYSTSLVNFVTTDFVLFFLPVLCIGWGLRGLNRTVYKFFLLIANLVFYGMTGVGYLPFLFFVALINWGTVKWMEERSRNTRLALVSIAVVVHVLLLGFFKYYGVMVDWAMEQFGARAEWILNPTLAQMMMPVGLSFYCFQGLAYTIGHYRESALAPRSFTDVLCFLSFFPTVMSGPIIREENFFPQLRTSIAGEEDFGEGALLILSGLFKKVALATYLQMHLVDAVFANPEEYSSAAVLVGIYAYTVQIYCDFSGYTDIAMGVARLMGFHLPKNFDAPYRSLSLQEFWHRWHISLSTWLRDYLYIPLGGSRRGNRYVNLFITMLIGGAWHGSSLTFIIWGALHGIGLAIVHAFQRVTRRVRLNSLWLRIPNRIVSWVLTLHVVAFLWVFFRADSLDSAYAILCRVHAGTTEGNDFPLLVLVATVWGILLSFVGRGLFQIIGRALRILPWPLQAIVVGLSLAFIMNLGPDGTLPFIYFRF